MALKTELPILVFEEDFSKKKFSRRLDISY